MSQLLLLGQRRSNITVCSNIFGQLDSSRVQILVNEIQAPTRVVLAKQDTPRIDFEFSSEDGVYDLTGGTITFGIRRSAVASADVLAPVAGVIDDGNMATDDFGDFSCAGATEDCRLDADAINALTELAGTLCGTNQILEDQGASWGCINTPAGGSVALNDLTDVDLTWFGATVTPPDYVVYRTDDPALLREAAAVLGTQTRVGQTSLEMLTDSAAVPPPSFYYKVLPGDGCNRAIFPCDIGPCLR